MVRIAYQGCPGAYSHLAAEERFPGARTMPMPDFASVLRAVERGEADHALLPLRNSLIGEIPGAAAALEAATRLVVLEEVAVPVILSLLALPGAVLTALRSAESHPAALAQCARFLSAHRLVPRPVADTAGAAQRIAVERDFTCAAVAGPLAAERYGLATLVPDIADGPGNRTTFAVVARSARWAAA